MGIDGRDGLSLGFQLGAATAATAAANAAVLVRQEIDIKHQLRLMQRIMS